MVSSFASRSSFDGLEVKTCLTAGRVRSVWITCLVQFTLYVTLDHSSISNGPRQDDENLSDFADLAFWID